MQMVLPEIVTLDDFNGDAIAYLEDRYALFRNDFVLNKPRFRGMWLGLKKHPLYDGREASFFHFTHEGRVESERLPDLARCERLAWIKFIIDNSDDPDLKVWKKPNGRNDRIFIYHEEESYVLILEDRGSFILPWTAYLVKYNNVHRGFLKDYDQYAI